MKIIQIIFDGLFPPRHSDLVVRHATSKDIAVRYSPRNTPLGFCLSSYKDPLISALITENKFHHHTHATKLLFELIRLWSAPRPGQLLFIPIPLGPRRERERGYNQVHSVLQHVDNPNHSVRTDLLTRTRDTRAQVTLSRDERLQNVTGAFTGNASKLRELRDVTIVLVDDVYTTGATMRAARAALGPHLDSSVSLICLALAH
jgi:ComF family protein